MKIEFPKHISIFIILQRSHSFNKQPSCLPCCPRIHQVQGLGKRQDQGEIKGAKGGESKPCRPGLFWKDVASKASVTWCFFVCWVDFFVGNLYKTVRSIKENQTFSMDPAFVCICPGCPEVPVPQKWRREPCLVSAAERGEDGIFCWLRSQSAAIYQTVFSVTSLKLGTPHFSFQEQHATTGRELPSQTAKIQRGVNDYWGSTSAQTTMKGLATAPNTWAWVQLRPKKTQTGDGLGGVTGGKNGQGIPNQLL